MATDPFLMQEADPKQLQKSWQQGVLCISRKLTWFCWFLGLLVFCLFVFLNRSLEHKADNAKENVLLTEWCSEVGFQMAD